MTVLCCGGTGGTNKSFFRPLSTDHSSLITLCGNHCSETHSFMNSYGNEDIHAWFGQYTRHHMLINSKDRYPVTMKIVHCQRVRREALMLGRDLGLDTRDLCIADAAGLLHDIGRFPQYSKHKTFVDYVSVNHAELGAQVLKENLVLRKFSEREQQRILTAIRYHNRVVLPADIDRKLHLLSRILRDADKLDIWRVFTEHNKLSKDEQNKTVDQDLPDGDSCSEKALADIMAGKLVDFRHVASKNDFALMRLAWVYDVNFTHTFRQILARNYLQTLHLTLPQDDKITAALEAASTYVEQKAAGL